MKYALSRVVCLFPCILWSSIVVGKNDVEEAKLNGKVKSITTTMWQGNDTASQHKGRVISKSIAHYNEDGMVTLCRRTCDVHSLEKYRGVTAYITSSSSNMMATYDVRCRKIMQVTSDCKDSVQDSTVYEYDANDNCSRERIYSAEGKLIQQTIYAYNEHNKCIEWTRVDDSIRYVVSCSYNEHMDLVKRTETKNGKVTWVYANIYSSSGKRIEERQYHDEELFWRRQYKYNTHGELIEQREYNRDDSLSVKTIYSYGRAGKKLTDTTFDYQEPGKVVMRRHAYYSHDPREVMDVYENKVLTWHRESNKSGNAILSIEYFYDAKAAVSYKKFVETSYDKHGNEVLAIGRTIEGNGLFSTPQSSSYRYEGFKDTRSYKYDTAGNLVQQIDYADGVVQLITEVEITYY